MCRFGAFRGRRTAARAALALALAGAALPVSAHVGIEELDARSQSEVSAHPRSGEAHLERARVLHLRQAWDAALVELEEAAAHAADRDLVARTKAAIFLDAGFPRMAKLEVERVLARRPEAWDLYWDRGRTWLALGDADAAARDFGQAIARGSRPTPEQVIARRDALLSLGRVADALRALDEGMARVGHVVALQLPAVDLEVELGRHEAALARLDALAGTAPPNPVWMARRGDVLAKAGRHAEARAEYAKALALIGARRGAHRGQAWTELERRLETALAASGEQGGTR